MSESVNRTYLYYNDENLGDSIILSFRSKDSLNKHISRLGIHESKIIEISNDMPINRNLSDLEINRILQSIGYQDIGTSKHKGGFKHRSVHV